MSPDAVRDALALIKSYQDMAARDWEDYDRFGEERAAILRHADLVKVCDVLAITVAAAVVRLGMDAEEFLNDVRSRLGGDST